MTGLLRRIRARRGLATLRPAREAPAAEVWRTTLAGTEVAPTGRPRCNQGEMVWRLVVAVLLVVAAVVADGVIDDEPAAPRRVAEKPHVAGCARQSIASFPGAFTSAENLVVGPLALIGAGELTTRATVREFGGNKFPAVVRAGRTVTVEVRGRRASLFYAKRGGGVLVEARVADGDRAVTFRSCGRRRAESDADGDPVTFWSGFVLVARPMCVDLTVRSGSGRARHAAIPLGRRCG